MKKKTEFVCSACGYSSPKWFGRCPSCGEWDTAREYKVPNKKQSGGREVIKPVARRDVFGG